MRISRDDDVLLTQLAALAREEDAAARAQESRLGSLDAVADRAYDQLIWTLRNGAPLAAAERPSLWRGLQRMLRSTFFLPVLVAAGGVMVVLCLPREPPRSDVASHHNPLAGAHTKYELSVLSGGAGLRGSPSSSTSPASLLDVQPSPELPVLRAGSTVRFLLRPQEQTAIQPQVALLFDDGARTEPWRAEIERAADGPMQVLATLPARAGHLKIQLFSADMQASANQQWSLAVESQSFR